MSVLSVAEYARQRSAITSGAGSQLEMQAQTQLQVQAKGQAKTQSFVMDFVGWIVSPLVGALVPAISESVLDLTRKAVELNVDDNVKLAIRRTGCVSVSLSLCVCVRVCPASQPANQSVY